MKDERQAFEEWALALGLAYRDQQYGVCFYDAGDAAPSWHAWKGRAALSAASHPQEAALAQPGWKEGLSKDDENAIQE